MRKLFLFLTLLAAMLALQGCITIPFPLGKQDVREVVYERGSGLGRGKIAIIDVSGVLTSGGESDGFFASDSSVVDLDLKLKLAQDDRNIRAVILRIDSPGGGVTASDIMYRQIKRYREASGVPVYVSMQNLAASGGYYISMAADKVYAHPTTVTGSIGVIAAFPEARGLMDKIGVEMNAIKTGPNKDAGAFYQRLQPEQRKVYQDLIDNMFDKFIAVIVANRTNLTEARIRELADGRVYSADAALENGLIDGIAYLDEVIEAAKQANNLKRPDIILIRRSAHETTDTIYAAAAPAEPQQNPTFNLINVDMGQLAAPSGSVFNYLWVP